MKIEDQVCSEFQSKRLCELGVNALAHFVWVPKFPVFNDTLRLVTMMQFDNQLANSILSQEARNLVNFYPAYSVAELGVMLPEFNLTYKGTDNSFACFDMREQMTQKRAEEWHINFLLERGDFSNEKTEAQCRADMLIHLLENKLITADQVNQSLKQ